MNEEKSKGITAVIGIILLVAVAVILIVIIATFFIGFTTSTTQEVAASTPKVQVLSAFGCTATDGTVNIENTLSNPIPRYTQAEITSGGKSFGLVRTTLSSIAAGGSALIGFDYGANNNRPVYFPVGQDLVITFKEGDARGQTAQVNCEKPTDWFTFDIDSSSNKVTVKSTIDFDKGNNTTICNNTWEIWEGNTLLSDGNSTPVNDVYCPSAAITDSAATGQQVHFYPCASGGACDNTTALSFKADVMYTFQLSNTSTANEDFKDKGTIAWGA